MKLLRRLGIALGAILALVLLAAGAGLLWLRTSLPQTDGNATIAGLRGQVDIIRDANAVPHIFAANEHDAFFALGYVHAQDRLFQMELMRRVGSGRLAEIVGATAVGIDRYIRTMGIPQIAAANFEGMSADGRATLQAYADGVNAWLANRSGALPPEFVLLRFEPEPWKPTDSLLWSRLMALRLGRNQRTELVRVLAARALEANRLPATLLDELWPQPPENGPATIPDAVMKAAALFETLPSARGSGIAADSGSNGWILHGSRTATGKPILANDPHLRFGAPILWYLARLKAPGLQLTGTTTPGVPFFILGHNGTIAWGMTSADGDVEDHFVESIDPADPGRYLTPQGAVPFTTRTETIRVKDGEDVILTVRETRHGPVISDESDSVAAAAPGQAVALATPALRGDDRTADALFAINRARNWTDFRSAAAEFQSPNSNLFFAATDGDIGFVSAGRIPIRKSGDGRVPAIGADGSGDWTGFVPADELPALHNPPAGEIVNANNRTVDDSYPWMLTRDWNQPFRADRIREVLSGAGPLTVDASIALQQDSLSTAARLLVPELLKGSPRSDRARKALAMLKGWDFTMRRERPEPLIYAAWLDRLGDALVADEIGGPLAAHYQGLINRPGPRFVHLALTERQHWCDDIRTPAAETCEDRLNLALEQALDGLAARFGGDMASWRWGELHRATFTHQVLTHVPVLKEIADIDIPSDGGNYTVNRGGYVSGEASAPFAHLDGAGYRAVYDLSNLDNSRFMIATGQSGNFLSGRYRDLLPAWRDGRYITIGGGREAVRRTAAHVLTLTPR
jgi:penicillin amidase